MKIRVFWLAAMAAGVSMTGCSLDDVMDQAEVRNIGFDAFANKSSRATTNAQQFGHTSFGVWGRYTDSGGMNPVEVFEDKLVTWSNSDDLDDNNGSWTYSPLVPWVGDAYEFAAIAPHGIANADYNYDTNTYIFGDVTVDLTENKQVDYLVADVKENVNSTGGTVDFTFNHVLSKVDFRFVPQTSGDNAWKSSVKITVTGFTLGEVVSVGDCSVKYPDETTQERTITWNNADTPVNFRYSEPLESSYTVGGTNTTTESGLSTPAWLVIPQTGGERTLSITCDIYDITRDAVNGVLIKKGATAEVAIGTDWLPNTYYTYTVYIGTDILGTNPYITFDVTSVNGWDDNESTDIEVEAPSQNP